MLPENDRIEVIIEVVRFIMEDIHVEAEVPIATETLEGHFEANDDDIGDRDEINAYIHSTQLS